MNKTIQYILLCSVRLLLVISIYFLGTTNIFAKNKLYYYEPQIAVLEGIIEMKAVEAAVGDCDLLISKWDRKVMTSCPFLKLEQPIDVRIPTGYSKVPADPKRDKPEKNVKILQISGVSNSRYTFKAGERWRIQGSLYRHFSNCDHTRVLIDLEIAEKISN